ncbi:hypothetical protein PSYPI_46996, partial [Pseudomonas syringae pv. pisi str. 1704B]
AWTRTTPPPAPTGSSTASTAEWGLVDDDAPGPQA